MKWVYTIVGAVVAGHALNWALAGPLKSDYGEKVVTKLGGKDIKMSHVWALTGQVAAGAVIYYSVSK